MTKLKDLKNISILYADDDDVLRASTVHTLSTLFDTVYSARNGEEAIEIYKDNTIHILMLDIKMGDVSGIDVVKYIRSHNPDIPIFLVSSYSDTKDMIEAIKLNLVDYLQKPFSFKTLLDTLMTCTTNMYLSGLLMQKLGENVYYDQLSKHLFIDGKRVTLTKMEIQTVEYLLKNRGIIISYSEFMGALGGDITEIALKNIISRLRKKMGNDSIKNISKIGYILS